MENPEVKLLRCYSLSGIKEHDEANTKEEKRPIKVEQNEHASNNLVTRYKRRLSANQPNNDCQKKRKTILDDLTKILKKEENQRTQTELAFIYDCKHLVGEAEARIKRSQLLKQRLVEQEESLKSVQVKSEILANLLIQSKNAVIYTGAGISTSALIPDYRGPNGLWTQLKKTGTFSITKQHDLSTAEPTLTHMSISKLCAENYIKHVVSQNCDGLHLRSGINQENLSEIHGNMYIEVCLNCKKQYHRQADITEKTSRFRHKTGRKCHYCKKEPENLLFDTIVLYGERSKTDQPMNWLRASKAAEKADLIICMGTSLKTLRHYDNLWPKKDQNKWKRDCNPKLVIINLQYTSKDKVAFLKINAKCDLVMSMVMKHLGVGIPSYSLIADPLRTLHIPFTEDEKLCLKRNLLFEIRKSISCTLPGWMGKGLATSKKQKRRSSLIKNVLE